jgi:uncharacterized membrane protein YkvA (DUF1232 family)
VKQLLRVLPNLVRLIARLVNDPVLPRAAKIALAAAMVYLASPLDLLPDFIPLVGYLDDLLLASVVVDGLLNWVDRGVVLKYWPGSPDSLERVARAARLLAVWVPGRIKARIFSWLWGGLARAPQAPHAPRPGKPGGAPRVCRPPSPPTLRAPGDPEALRECVVTCGP